MKSGFSVGDIIISAENSLIAINKNNLCFVSKEVKGKGSVCCVAEPDILDRWFEHQTTVDKIERFHLTVVTNDEQLGEISFSDMEQKSVASAISALEKMKAEYKGSGFERKTTIISMSDCRDNTSGLISGSVGVAIVLGVFSLFGLFSAGPSEEEIAKEREATIRRDCSREIVSYGLARQFVRDALKPRSVSFIEREMQFRSLGDCQFAFFGAVDGQNAFGVPVRNYYTIRMEGRVSETGLRWFGTTPMIDSNMNMIRDIYQRTEARK